MDALNEELIAAWMRLISVVENRRVVSGMSFNEALICNLLARQGEDGFLTASELCQKTRILKSQMNSILRSLEEKEIISRTLCPTDRRITEIRLKENGGPVYHRSHAHTLAIMDRLIAELGQENVETLLPLLHRAADILDQFSLEV